MKLKQLVVSIENSPERLYEVTNALGMAGINLRALNLVDTGAFGQLRLLVSDVPKARQILMELHMPAFQNEVIAVEIQDTANSLANLLEPLTKEGLHVVFMYAFAGFTGKNAVMIFRFSDNDKAVDLLQRSGTTILDENAFGMLESNG